MPTYEGPARVLCAYDGSDDATRALEFAAAEALVMDADLAVVNVVDDTVLNTAWGIVFNPEDIRKEGEKLLESAVEIAERRGVPRARIRTKVLFGSPIAVLEKMSTQVSMIVVGRRAISGTERMYVGSTSVGLAAVSDCPVIMISAASLTDDIKHFGAVGLGLDSSGKGSAALHFAMDRAKQAHGRLQIVSVLQTLSKRTFDSAELSEESSNHLKAVARNRVSAMVRPVVGRYPDVPVDIDVVIGNAVDVLVEYSARLDMLVLEVHTSFPMYSVGGTVRAVMTYARCPVALVHA